MKTKLLLFSPLCIAIGFSFSGCKKNEPNPALATKAEPTKTEPVKAEPVKAEPTKAEPVKAEPTKAEPAAGKIEGTAEEHCGAAYDFIKQLSEAFAKKMPAGKKAKELPPREKYVNACKELPIEVVRCMNPKIAMTEADKCKEVLAKVDKTKLDKVKAMMTK
jgi:hypothetical protein